jgi:DNA-binding SARP family transcriptional activator
LNAESFSKACRLLIKNEPQAGDSLKLLPKPNNFMIVDAPFDYQHAIQKPQTPSLKVYFFGKFRVFQGDEEIPDKRWKSKKAQMLFKYLLYLRPKGYLKKDVLMELLWPDDDPAKTAKRFHVALASLRRTLEPAIVRGTPSSYITRSSDAYRIDLGVEGSVDIEDFTKELKLAQEKQNPDIVLQHYLNAVSLYQGDFLEEDLYVPWCDEERERVKEDYIYILTKIIQYYENKKDYSACIDYVGRYLKVDKYAENIYQQLMRYYAQVSNKAMVVRTFERCKENITKELDIPLSRETETLFQKLISSYKTETR